MTSFDQVLAQLDSLPAGKPKLPWALSHCAQSIELSMTGYPQMRSGLFRATIGRLALAKFLKAGEMSHDTDAPVAGAPEISPGVDLATSTARLKAAIASFRAYAGPMAPHLAYGPVTRQQYEAVHSMHLANHLKSIAE